MKGRSLLALPALVLALGCEDHQQPTGLSVPNDPSEIIRDGAHGGNRDFFFLPPLVPFPLHNPDFELGKFNNALKPSLKIEICQLKAEHLNARGLPTAATGCVAGPPLKAFAPGTVKLVNLPLRQFGWWSLFNLPPDGFYYVLWDTRQSNLNVNKYYRIKVLLDGSTVPLGVADVDPMSSLREWKYTLTGEVVQLIDDVLLPIPFRVEKGAFCSGASLCTSVTVTNNNPNDNPDGSQPYQIVRVEGNNGPIAGAFLPDGWLPPPPGPQSVVLTISRVNTGATNVGAGTQATPCHANLPLQQFNGCFNFNTIPQLPAINEAGDQFALPITVAVCFVLIETPDPREPWVQLWSSDVDESPRPLPSSPDALILTNADARNCGNNLIGFKSSNGLTRLASAGWGELKGGLGQLFGVKTAYAVDLGLGGLTKRLSNIGPALTAEIQRYTGTGLTLGPGATTTSTARIVGTRVHNGGALTTGIGGLPVTFTVAPGNGTLRLLDSEAPPATQLTSITNTNPIDEGPVSGGGFAPVNWTMPTTPGTYTLTATGPATGGPVTFTATVPAPPPFNFIQLGPTERRMLSMQTGATIQLTVTPPNEVAVWFVNSGPQNVEFILAQPPVPGLLQAVIGGENIAGGADASITSILAFENPGPSLLVNSFSFDLFPRTTTLVWNPVAGAVSYQVVPEIGMMEGGDIPPFPLCAVPADCTKWTQEPQGTTTTTGLMHTFDFGGANPGRWRVFARNASGAVIATSPYVYFSYDI